MIEVITRNIEWINYLDRMYIVNAKESNNSSFYYYPYIDINVESENINLIFRKKADKTQFLFIDNNGRKLYLSDVDIINIITSSEVDIYNTILEVLLTYITKLNAEEKEFKVNDEIFYYNSILTSHHNISTLDVLFNNTFESEADLTIKYIDLVTLISLIINKEYLVDHSRSDDRTLRQAKKFYVLSKFYKENQYEDKLRQLKFDTSKSIEEIYNNNKIAKSVDKIFGEIVL